MKSPTRRRLGRLLLSVMSLLVTLVFLEGMIRVYFKLVHRDIAYYRPSSFYLAISKQDWYRFTSHPFLPYAPRPYDARKLYPFRPDVGRIVELDYANNSLGFRTPERPFKKPPMTKRVIALGGSTTFDGPTNNQTWPALLEKRLNERYAASGFRVEVVDLAVDMAASPYSLIDLAFLGIEYEPDLVLSYDGVNDISLIGYEGFSPDYRSAMNKYDEKEAPLQSKLPPWTFHSYLVCWASFKFDRRVGAKPDLASRVYGDKLTTLQPSKNQLEGVEYFERNLRLMRAISNEYGAKFLAATSHWVHVSDKVAATNDELRRFFATQRIDFVDLDKELPHDDWSIHVDIVHWSLKGEETMADTWEAKIISLNALGLEPLRR